MAFVLGHARYLKAMPGGQAKNDPRDAPKIAVLLRGGMLPQASVYPAERRATRDSLRRRMSRMRQRAALRPQVQQTSSPDHLPAIGKTIADKANRAGVAARFPDPAIQKSLEVDLTRLGYDDGLLTELERWMVNTAKEHKAQVFHRLRSLPGGGTSLALVLLDESHGIHRVPRVQEFVSSCRLVPCAKESAGQRYGAAGSKLGKADLKWAFSEAAVLSLRHHPAGQQSRAR